MNQNDKSKPKKARHVQQCDIIKVSDPQLTDIVILIMGPTGAGKSTFINTAVGWDATSVREDLNGCTKEIQSIVVPRPNDDRRIVFVDIPGFNDTWVHDAEILERIMDWMTRSYGEGMKIAGVVHVHEISQARDQPTSHDHLVQLNRLCADKDVVLATTKWGDIKDGGQAREKKLSETHWKVMLKQGSTMMRFEDTKESAWAIVDIILNNVKLASLRITEPDLKETDIIIPIIGPAGVGKSTFINTAVREAVTLVDETKSCTKTIQPVIAFDGHRRVLFVDTPGFNDDTLIDNALSVVTDWLAHSCKARMNIAGIIYLYDMSQARVAASQESLKAMDTLRYRRVVPFIILATTKFDSLSMEMRKDREIQLSQNYWKKMLDKGGSLITQFKGTHESAWEIADIILKKPIDIVIPIMGPTGVGKSTFINIAARRIVTSVGDDPCTNMIDPITVPHPSHATRRIVFVDTPGFKDKLAEDAENLKKTTVWLARSFEGMIVAGVIYLHLCQTHLPAATRNHLMACTRLCREGTVPNVILATSRWGDIMDVSPGEELGLSEVNRLPSRLRMMPFDGRHESAWAIVDAILKSIL